MSISEGAYRQHNPDLLDQLADLTWQPFEGFVWRATRLSHDPLAYSNNGGRWAPPSTYQPIPVLYTSFERDGAVMEMANWLSMLVPRPSKPIMLHQLNVHAKDVLTLNFDDLASFGIERSNYADRTYAAHDDAQLSRSQEIGAALSFLGVDGLVVPSARHPCNNLILFDNADNQVEIEVVSSYEIDWIKALPK